MNAYNLISESIWKLLIDLYPGAIDKAASLHQIIIEKIYELICENERRETVESLTPTGPASGRDEFLWDVTGVDVLIKQLADAGLFPRPLVVDFPMMVADMTASDLESVGIVVIDTAIKATPSDELLEYQQKNCPGHTRAINPSWLPVAGSKDKVCALCGKSKLAYEGTA